MDLEIKVVAINGNCPVYKIGDGFTLEDGYMLNTESPLCMHALASLMPYYNALRFVEPEKLGLAGKVDNSKAYIQCSDAASHTGGGTVIFEINRTGAMESTQKSSQ